MRNTVHLRPGPRRRTSFIPHHRRTPAPCGRCSFSGCRSPHKPCRSSRLCSRSSSERELGARASGPRPHEATVPERAREGAVPARASARMMGLVPVPPLKTRRRARTRAPRTGENGSIPAREAAAKGRWRQRAYPRSIRLIGELVESAARRLSRTATGRRMAALD